MAVELSEPWPNYPPASVASHTIPPLQVVPLVHTYDMVCSMGFTMDRDDLPKHMQKLDEWSSHSSDFDENIKWTEGWAIRRSLTMENAVRTWLVEQAYHDLKKDEPEQWYLASRTMISEGNKKMISGNMTVWFQETSEKSSKADALMAIKAVKEGFKKKLEQKAGWGFWREVLDEYEEPKPRITKSSQSQFESNMMRKKQYILSGLEAMPLMYKALQARENVSAEIEATKLQIIGMLNEYAHKARLKSFPDSYNPKTKDEKYRIVTDGITFKSRTSAPDNSISIPVAPPSTAVASSSQAMQNTPPKAMDKVIEAMEAMKLDPASPDNTYHRMLRWVMRRYIRDHRHDDDEHDPVLFYGRDGNGFIESDGPAGDRWVEGRFEMPKGEYVSNGEEIEMSEDEQGYIQPKEEVKEEAKEEVMEEDESFD